MVESKACRGKMPAVEIATCMQLPWRQKRDILRPQLERLASSLSCSSARSPYLCSCRLVGRSIEVHGILLNHHGGVALDKDVVSLAVGLGIGRSRGQVSCLALGGGGLLQRQKTRALVVATLLESQR